MIPIQDLEAAAARLAPVAHRTPIFHSTLIDERVGGRLFLKMECFQRSGAFKFRGAYNAIAQQLDPARERGVVTASSGNHGGAVALAAHLLGVRATVVVPEDAVEVKLAAMRARGARIERCGRTSSERLDRAQRLVESEGLLSIPPYDHPAVMAGQGTTGLEILEQVQDVDLILVPCGGGGLLAGVASAVKARRPGVEVHGVEPESGDDWFQSRAAGHPVTIPLPDTLADGARNVRPGHLTFPIVQQTVSRFHRVSEDRLCVALALLLTRVKAVVEPTGALGVAAALHPDLHLHGRTAVAILSGGNVDPATLARCTERGLAVLGGA